MELTELSHWEYRVKALEADVKETRRILNGVAGMDIMKVCGEMDALFKTTTFTELGRLKPFEAVEDMLKHELYLLEEAKYKVQLGNTTNRNRCSHPVYVAELRYREAGHTSVHRLQDTAERKIREVAARWGIDPDRLDDQEDSAEVGIIFGVSKLEVEP